MLRIQKFSIKISKQPNVNISTNYPLLKGTINPCTHLVIKILKFNIKTSKQGYQMWIFQQTLHH